jgi:alpha-D-ribose 1-methylphosphonate 5-triphosphate diphosphatase
MSHYESVAATTHGLNRLSQRFQVPADDVISLLNQYKVRKPKALQEVKRLALVCRDYVVAMASHDEEKRSVRRWYHNLGCSICEFPVFEPVAAMAVELGDEVVAGAPNVLKGGSLYGRLSSRELVKQGLCTILASDYYYPAQLQAAFMLSELGIGGLGDMWNLISLNPARALGLHDRGLIQKGMRADLVAVDDTLPGLPRVRASWVNGAVCYHRP